MSRLDGMMSARFDGALKGIILLTIPVFAILSVISVRALYIDGSHYLLNVILSSDFFIAAKARTFVHVSTQILPLLLLKAGVGDLNVLIRAYTIDLCLYPLAVWALVLWRAVKSDELAVYCTLFAVVYLNGMYFHGESIPTYAFTVLVFSILDSKAKIAWRWAIAGVISCFILILSYEATLFLGALLAVRGTLRLIYHPDPGQRVLTLATVILSLASSASAAYFLIYTQHGQPLAPVTELSLLWQNHQCALSAVSGGGVSPGSLRLDASIRIVRHDARRVAGGSPVHSIPVGDTLSNPYGQSISRPDTVRLPRVAAGFTLFFAVVASDRCGQRDSPHPAREPLDCARLPLGWISEVPSLRRAARQHRARAHPG
jgi:hypothetical protein